MALNINFFEEDTIHGMVKRFMYMRHLQAFVPITQESKFRTIIYDAFAGPGRYGNNWPDAIEELGSPLIALRVVIEYFIKRNELKFSFNKLKYVSSDLRECICFDEMTKETHRKKTQKIITMPNLETDVILNFSEAGESRCFELLLNVTHVFKFYGIEYELSNYPCGVISVISSDKAFPIGCNIALSEFRHTFLPKCKRSRYMTFIDPFGFSDIPMSHVQNFLGRGKEVLITFMSGFVNRFKNLKKNKKTVMELFGLCVDDDEYSSSSSSSSSLSSSSSSSYHITKYQNLKCSTKSDAITNCLRFYEDQLKEKADTDMVLTFEIRNIRNIRIYHLIFITNHEKGLETMKEAMNRGTQSPESFSLSEYKILRKGITLSLKNIQNNVLIAHTIFNKFEGKKDVRISRIKRFILLDTPFVFRKKALKILEIENNPRLIKVVDKYKQRPRRKGNFPDFPGETDWLLTFRMRDVLEFPVNTDDI